MPVLDPEMAVEEVLVEVREGTYGEMLRAIVALGFGSIGFVLA